MAGPLADVWPLLFDLAVARPSGWFLAGSQMVILHAAVHGIARPLATEDADVIVDVRELPVANVSNWLTRSGFELGAISPDGVGHRFHRRGITIDVLAIDHVDTSDLTTVPPARTIPVPGGRRAVGRVTSIEVTTADGHTGTIPLPDWLGAVLLKARAATIGPHQRAKHLQDLALLLGMPEDLPHWADQMAGRDRAHLRRAAARLDEHTLRGVAAAVNINDTRAALAYLT